MCFCCFVICELKGSLGMASIHSSLWKHDCVLGRPSSHGMCSWGAELAIGQWIWTLSSLWVRTGMPRWDRTEKYVLLHHVLLPLLRGFRATRMVFSIYAFIHSSEEKKLYILALPTWYSILFTLVCSFICSFCCVSPLLFVFLLA